MRRKFTVDPNELLRETRERPLGVHVPAPISERLDDLVEILEDAGSGRISRKELVAALLLAAPRDPQQLEQAVRRYRTAKVEEALVHQRPVHGEVIELRTRPPGPRTHGQR